MSRFPTASFAASTIRVFAARVPVAACVIAASIIVAAAPAVRAYWVADGVAICTAAGDQQ